MDISFLYENRKKTDLLFLGSHHWKNFGLDAINVDSGNMLSEDRQSQLDDLLGVLTKYNPTKVMIEWPANKQELLDKRYENYLNGEFDLNNEENVWEGYQIGFRLAKKLGHSRIYGIDNRDPDKTDLDFNAIMGYIQENDLQYYGSVVQQFMQTAPKFLEEIINLPLIESYRKQNSEEMLWLNQMFYYVISEIGEGWEGPGLKVATKWYKRNLDISSNIAKIIDFHADERVFIVFGQGHIPYMKDNAIRSPFYTITEYESLLD